MKLADIGEFLVEGCGDCLRLIDLQIEGAGIGEDDSFVVKAQVYRVGT